MQVVTIDGRQYDVRDLAHPGGQDVTDHYCGYPHGPGADAELRRRLVCTPEIQEDYYD